MNTAIGIVTYGNHKFTELGLKELQAQGVDMKDVILIIGKPGDEETRDLANRFELIRYNSSYMSGKGSSDHKTNKGFPSSINDIYDIVFTRDLTPWEEYGALIIMGNDVVPYPGAIKALTTQADLSDHDVICSCMFDCKALCARYPEARKYFTGNNFEFTDFSARPWDLHGPQNIPAYQVVDGNRGGLHDLTLFKCSVYEKIGYLDVNFFPAYYSDNDYWRRLMLREMKVCSVTTATYFHFWSRTIHQAGESAHTGGVHFRLNEEFYRAKWGGALGRESFQIPWNGAEHELAPGIKLPPTLEISSRQDEDRIIEYWKQKAKH